MALLIENDADYIGSAVASFEFYADDKTLNDKLAAIQDALSSSSGTFPEEVVRVSESLRGLSDDIMSLFASTALLLRNVGTIFAEVDANAANDITNAGS